MIDSKVSMQDMSMQLIQKTGLTEFSDQQLMAEKLHMNNAHLLELGCGAALVTRKLAEAYPSTRITAAEVDRVQHDKNLQIDDLPNVDFILAGMQDIPLPDGSADLVIMLKSLHHVPIELLSQGFREIHRVLKNNGRVYISEPVFDGAFNEILKMFNNEEQVRKSAFEAIKQEVNSGRFDLVEEIHFLSRSQFDDFKAFEERILNATHSEFNVSAELKQAVMNKFNQHSAASDGSRVFLNPMRVDILAKV
jgi:ubiquinone/menaquinone biosynthesis C-methylase UbiE